MELPELPELARDAAYVAVGFAVLAFQKAQVRRRELQRELGSWCPSRIGTPPPSSGRPS